MNLNFDTRLPAIVIQCMQHFMSYVYLDYLVEFMNLDYLAEFMYICLFLGRGAFGSISLVLLIWFI